MSEVTTKFGLVEHTILWAGGWDKYLVDLDQIVDVPAEMVKENGFLKDPTFTFSLGGSRYMHCRELNRDWYNDKVLMPNPAKGIGIHSDNKGVLIVRRLGGGD